MKIECRNPEQVVKRMFWLAWQACGGPFNMGFLQDKPDADEEAVWSQTLNRGDYPSGNASGQNKIGDAYGDYVFGRMMKLSVKWDDASVNVRDGVPRHDYQAWCVRYPTYASLVQAAIASLDQPAPAKETIS